MARGKFQVGDRVFPNERTPKYIGQRRYKPRTVVAVRYDRRRQARVYELGDNRISDALYYGFRSYQLTSTACMRPKGRPKKVAYTTPPEGSGKGKMSRAKRRPSIFIEGNGDGKRGDQVLS